MPFLLTSQGCSMVATMYVVLRSNPYQAIFLVREGRGGGGSGDEGNVLQLFGYSIATFYCILSALMSDKMLKCIN